MQVFEIMIFLSLAFSFFAFLFGLFSFLKLKKINETFSDKNTLNSLIKNLDSTQKKYQEVQDLIKNLSLIQKNSFQSSGIVYFDPFKGSGNTRLSFALAVVSLNGDGFILSTIHSQSSVSVFAKEVRNFKPIKKASEEELQALEKAINSLHNRG